MKRRLNIDWKQYLGQELDANKKWIKFKKKFQEAIEECVPKRQAGMSRTRTSRNMNLPMNRRLWSKVKKKQRLWERLNKAKSNGTSVKTCREIEVDYRRLNNQVRNETRNAVKVKEKEVARHVKDNPKIFWKYVASKTRLKPNISELYKNNEKRIMTEGNKDKACVLSDQFSRVFIEEPEGDTPTAAPRNGRDIDSINITKEKINKRRKSTKPTGLWDS
ncbi:hypothetical protein Pmani_029051 [Petrolisthes manimaculis]|uniref:Uncharacterized protein n=1 Tax=Petrolisthes manimaculis TaxID=1843537 RepID=A0AAE1P0Y6_9EUCA|nr:hypothetical protein Pmani_029051 [Petrolisthes manimaculis]